jgi:hypothetical protein
MKRDEAKSEISAMVSPFPGMDPYLEDPVFWSDFQHRFNCWLSDVIADKLPDKYEAALGERNGWQRLPNELEEIQESFLEIRCLPNHEIVTVIELLCPANKKHRGAHEYLLHRKKLLMGRIQLVELNLLIGGRRLPAAKRSPPGDYYAIITRSERRPQADVYAWNVRQPLPEIPIPLFAPDRDIRVDLQAVFAMAYERGRFAKRLYYDRPLKARLAKSDLTWAGKVTKAVKT